MFLAAADWDRDKPHSANFSARQVYTYVNNYVPQTAVQQTPWTHAVNFLPKYCSTNLQRKVSAVRTEQVQMEKTSNAYSVAEPEVTEASESKPVGLRQ
jgi:hypothetical protein